MLKKFQKVKSNHILLFIGFLIVIEVLVIGFVLFYSLSNKQSSEVIQEAAKDLSLKKTSSQAQIKSNYGFTVNINKDIFEYFGTSVSKDQSYIDYTGEDVLVPNDYVIVTVYPKTSIKSGYYNLTISSSILKDFFEKRRAQYGSNVTDLELVHKHFSPLNSDQKDFVYKQLKESQVKLGGIDYLRYDYESVPVNKTLGSVLGKKKVALFITVQNGRPYAIRLDYDVEDKMYSSILKLISSISYQQLSKDVYLSLNSDELKVSKKDKKIAVAGISDTAGNLSGSVGNVRAVASNIPAVVRVGTLFCYDLELAEKNLDISVTFGRQLCSGGYGSGFFISSDGYIGTNGHVAYLSPRDAMVDALVRGDVSFLVRFLQFYGYVTQGVLLTDEVAGQLADLVYASKETTMQALSLLLKMPEEYISVKSEKSEYAIQLGSDPVRFDYDKSSDTTKLHFSDSIVHAELTAMDYSAEDLLKANFSQEGFSQSDVAILKIEGTNLPVTRIGNIDNLTQGSEITVIGFPGKSENELVDKTESKVTATNGVVSSVRKTSGNSKKLIQSDVSIDHGNSGGPAINTQGEVVGIATYGLFEEGGTFNYMRDVSDLVTLANTKGIKLNTASSVQTVWDDGLTKFFNSYFKSAIKRFNATKQYYPPHALAEQYKQIAQNKINNGEGKTEPIIFVVIGAIVGMLIIILGAVLLIVKIAKRRQNGKGGIPTPPVEIPKPPVIPAAPPPVVPKPPQNYTN